MKAVSTGLLTVSIIFSTACTKKQEVLEPRDVYSISTPEKENRIFDITLLGGKNLEGKILDITITNVKEESSESSQQKVINNQISLNLNKYDDVYINYGDNFAFESNDYLHGYGLESRQDSITLKPTEKTTSTSLNQYYTPNNFLYSIQANQDGITITGICIVDNGNGLVADTKCEKHYTNSGEAAIDNWLYNNGEQVQASNLKPGFYL